MEETVFISFPPRAATCEAIRETFATSLSLRASPNGILLRYSPSIYMQEILLKYVVRNFLLVQWLPPRLLYVYVPYILVLLEDLI